MNGGLGPSVLCRCAHLVATVAQAYGWKRINAERYRLFEGPPRKPELTEAQKTLAKKRQELSRVQERLAEPYLHSGMARELRKHVTILEREIAELESA